MKAERSWVEALQGNNDRPVISSTDWRDPTPSVKRALCRFRANSPKQRVQLCRLSPCRLERAYLGVSLWSYDMILLIIWGELYHDTILYHMVLHGDLTTCTFTEYRQPQERAYSGPMKYEYGWAYKVGTSLAPAYRQTPLTLDSDTNGVIRR